MPDRIYSPPPPLAVTIAGTTLALRFVDQLTVDGRERFGWADAGRGELLVSYAGDDGLDQLGRIIGQAVVQALWQLCPAYGVDPATSWHGDADVFLAGPELRAWLDGRLLGSLPAVSAAAWPAVRQRADGTWACPLCPATFDYLEHGPPGWHPLARDHVAEQHGIDPRRVRSIRYRAWQQPVQNGGDDV